MDFIAILFIIFASIIIYKIFKKEEEYKPLKYNLKKESDNHEIEKLDEKYYREYKQRYKKEKSYINPIKKINYIGVKEISNYFNIESNVLNQIFINLNWIERSSKWILTTELGELCGAKQKYNKTNKQKYVVWEEEIKEDKELIKEIEQYKQEKNTNHSMTEKEKKDKGDIYEEFITKYYRNKEYYVDERGKREKKKDGGIDLVAKKGKEILFIQCKNWSIYHKHKITEQLIQKTLNDVQNYLNIENNKIFQNYENKILYIASNTIFDKSAYTKINKHDNIEIKIIPMDYK